MSFEHNKSWDNFEKVVNSGVSIKDGWRQIIDFHKRIKKKSYWKDLETLDLEVEQQEIKNWLEALVTEEPFDKEIISFWIGICKFLDNEEREFYVIYLVGCKSYDNDDIEWASDPAYLPKKRYFVSKSLNEIDEKIKPDSDDYSFLDWILPLAYTSLALNDLIKNKLDHSKFLKYQDKIFVTTGHDSGDYLNINAIGVE
ncbi:MAG: hypothetical protein HOP30_14885 [Cyclobacteriaceae bacterium]|nr:hypothetical protein [Cyclobacteriaceae bacterium]